MAAIAACCGEQSTRRRRLAPVSGLAVISAGFVLLAGCTGGSSSSAAKDSTVAVAQKRTVAPFSHLSLAGPDDVTVRVGVRQSVIVVADRQLLSHVMTHVLNGTLTIANASGFTASSPASVEVSVPSLATVKLSGSGQLSVTGIKSPRLTVTISGAGLLYVSGRTAQLDVNISGDGTAELDHLVADDVQAAIPGSGIITATATKSLNAAITGDGGIIYSGNPPEVTTRVAGSGTVTRG